MEWSQHQQLFGEQDAGDLVSAIAFDSTGELVAVGDKGGQVSLFTKGDEGRYGRMGTFRSHEPEFDYLKSLEIEEKINKIKFLHSCNDSHFMLTTNDKTIKLWKVGEREQKVVQAGTPRDGQLVVPKVVPSGQPEFYFTPRRTFSNAHAYHINSISVNSDQETYISSDDLRINLWNLEISDQSFNIVDIKPPNMEELTEVITSAEFHPIQCNLFMYSSSKGTIKLCDMRESAICDDSSRVFEEEEDPANKSFFSEIISSISDIKFSNDGRFILARDYMTLKVWDIKMESEPVKTVAVHDYLKTKLCDLYENDCIFDKFECTLSHDARHLVTGSYGNWFFMHDMETGKEERIEVNRKGAKGFKMKFGKKAKDSAKINPDTIAFDQKCTQVAYHPTANMVAIGAGNNVSIYQAGGGSQ